MSYQAIFKRYEFKYLVTVEQKKMLLNAMEPFVDQDEYGRSTICSLYFDTPDYRVARESLTRPVYKEKLRLRSYGTAGEDSQVFMELKKKYHGVVYKRRIGAGQREAMDYLCGGQQALLLRQGIEGCGQADDVQTYMNRQILREIDCYRQVYPGIVPKVFLSYEREAFYGKEKFCGLEECALRVTFDENILWREEDLSLCVKPYGASLLEKGQVLMEVKTGGAIHKWLGRLLSENGIFPDGFSKYGNAYRQIWENGMNEKNNMGGKKYA